MPPAKKKRRPATRSQSQSLLETEAVESGLALNFFFFSLFSFLEKPRPLIIVSSSSSLFWSCYFFCSLSFLVVDLTRKGRKKCSVILFDFSFSRPVHIKENYWKVAQDIFWSQKLCFDERLFLIFFFLYGVHATWVSKNKFRTSLFFKINCYSIFCIYNYHCCCKALLNFKDTGAI